MSHHPDHEIMPIMKLIAHEDCLVIVEVNLEFRNIEYLLEKFIRLLLAERPMIKGLLFVLIDGIRADVIHDDSQRVIPVSLEAFQPNVNVVYVNDCIVYYPYEVLFGKSLLFPDALRPLLLHFHLDSLDHALQQLCRIIIILDLLIAHVEQNVDAFHCDYCALLLQIRPRDVDMYPLDMAELEGEWQSELVNEGRFERHVLDGDLSIEQPDVETIFKSINIFTKMLDEHTLDNILHSCLTL